MNTSTPIQKQGRSRSTKYTTQYPDYPFTIKDMLSEVNKYPMVYHRLRNDVKLGILQIVGKQVGKGPGAKRTIFQKTN